MTPADEVKPRRTRRTRRSRLRSADPRTANLVWVFKWVIIPFGTAAFVIAGGVEIGPALAAAEGHGTLGYFVAETENCSKYGCGWTGTFVTLGNQATRLNVDFSGPHGAFYRGDRVPAIDTGGPDGVFARHGSAGWVGDLALIIVGAIGFGLWSWRVPYRIVRRRLRGDTQ